MSGFRRIDLSKRRWTIPSVDYFRRLDAYCDELEQENTGLKEQLAKAGNAYYQADSERWGHEWTSLNIKMGQLEREKISVEAELQAQISRLQYEVDWLNEQLEKYQKAEKPIKQLTQRARDSKTGKFIAGVPTSQKPQEAYRLHNQGYNNSEIAAKLNVSSETVGRYIRQVKHKNDVYIETGSPKPGVYLAN